MTISEQDRVARGRFFMLTMVRLAGVILLGFGLTVSVGDVLRPGGWPAVGIPIAIVGFLESLLLPRFFARKWRTPIDR